jgi:hypothetical protein
VRPRLIAPPSAAVKQTTLGDKPSTGCSTPVLFELARLFQRSHDPGIGPQVLAGKKL